ncbi:GNAT family N-acetyltransferase [Paenibacillus sp. TAB 01]|uniref:GNAT family N-acetyltransferase n=1 Tax=Paenibacillus sp. TAB 01 TaxID=3368988 RepID=UPI0037528E4B
MIREAEARDRDALEALYRLLMPDDDRIQVVEERIEQIRRDANNFIFVSERENRVLGTALLHLCLDPMYGWRPFAVIENVIVDPQAQAGGVGRELLVHIEERCREAQCTEILIMSSLHRTEAHRFFEKLGFRQVAKGFKKYIP